MFGRDRTGCAVGIIAEELGYDRRDYEVHNPVVYVVKLGFDMATLKQIVSMNDVKRMSFNAIADWLEGNLRVDDPFRTLTASWIHDVKVHAWSAVDTTKELVSA